MTEAITFVAERRQRIGKGGARASRRDGHLPAVIYGSGGEPEAIMLDARVVGLQARLAGFHSHVYEIELDGKKQKVLARELQRDPVTGALLHLDLLRFSARSKVNVEVAIVLANEETCPGVKAGGMLNVVTRHLDLLCRADSIPESVSVDVGALQAGDTILVSDVALPRGVELGDSDPEYVVVSIVAPTVEAPPAEEGEEGEGEEGEGGESES